MANKSFPADLTSAVGDIVYQRSWQGTSIRQRVQPLNPQINRQVGGSNPLLVSGWGRAERAGGRRGLHRVFAGMQFVVIGGALQMGRHVGVWRQ